MPAAESVINVCSGVRLDPRYDHTIYFATPSAQLNYFAGKVVKTFSAYSYLRKSWSLQVDANMEDARTWTYLYFQNPQGGVMGKRYFYFITNIEYKNNGMIELQLELDVLQTYLFDMQRLPCFVERQHTVTDNAGDHTVDEGLEVGELVDNSIWNWSDLQDLAIMVLSSINPNHSTGTEPVDSLPYSYDGIFSGLTVWAIDGQDWVQWGEQLDALSAAGFADGIFSMWMYPKALITLGGEDSWDNAALCHVVKSSLPVGSRINIGSKPATVANMETPPKNKKLLTFPYSMLYVTNNAGGSAVYRYERFGNDEIYFGAAGTMSPDASVKIFPETYNGLANASEHLFNFDQGLSMSGYPVCAWDVDTYKMWLAQNQNQHQLAGATAAGTMIAGAATAIASGLTGNVMGAVGGVGAVVSGASQIAGLLAQKADMRVQPDQARGNFSASVNAAAGKLTFSFIHKSVSEEQARIIDDYFTMYGYRINRVKTPDIAARPAFTYVKTVGCKIGGNLCTDDILKIESIFDHGVTWWKDGDAIGDYSQPNQP